MANRVNLRIGGTSFALLADESPEYVQKLAEYLNARCPNDGTPQMTALALGGLAVTEELFQTIEKHKETEMQIRAYQEETVRLRSELSALKRRLCYDRTRQAEAEESEGGQS